MNLRVRPILLLLVLLGGVVVTKAADVVRTSDGPIVGKGVQPTGVRVFRGIPFAQPPTGELRWKEPHPVKSWKNVRPAIDFSPRCMQASIFTDMRFRSTGMSEDCLYLNVWTPAKSNRERLPVLVYFYGGGFVAGDSSEPRYDGESMAAKGIVFVTVNYRLGVFGFLAHPQLTQESPHKSSGNYGLLDQNAALRWVRQNITNFGGAPTRVTIAGESAGSISVSAHVASPLSKNLIAGAIGESGGITGTLSAVSLAKAEEQGSQFAADLGAESISAMRAMPTQQVFELATKGGFAGIGRFPIAIDGYFLSKEPTTIFSAGEQARVPLLVGWNSEEMTWRFLFGADEPTVENYKKLLARLYGSRADEALKLYPAASEDDVIQAATDLAGDRFIAYSTWKWADLHVKSSGKPVYRYFFTRPRPATPPARGAVHSAEIEYALGNLSVNNVYAWTADDYKVSELMQNYFANFIRRSDPNGPGLPEWPAIQGSGEGAQIMRIDVESRAESDKYRERYLFQDQFTSEPSLNSPQQSEASDRWIDYAAGDYEILPNVTYAKANNVELKLDLYLPKNRTSPTPTLILFHGGGWVDGQKERNVLFLLPYLALGWSAINVEYRTGHQSPAPAAVEDCRCALRWITYRARDYSLDPSRFILTGTSAGGHLALITGMLPQNNIFDRQCAIEGNMRWNSATRPEVKVAAIVNWFGITDVADLVDGPNARNYAREWFGSNNAELLAKQVSPISYVRPGLPPIITIHGENDDVAPYKHSVSLHSALEKAGVPNRLVTIRGRGHGGFSRQELLDSYEKIRQFLRTHGL